MTETKPLDTTTIRSADCPYRDDRGMTVREYRDHIKNTECKPPERANWLNSGSFGSMLKGRGLVAERLETRPESQLAGFSTAPERRNTVVNDVFVHATRFNHP